MSEFVGIYFIYFALRMLYCTVLIITVERCTGTFFFELNITVQWI